MTDYYVGIGGNDGSDGLSWANRKLTLNGAEDVPVAAGDTVYVGPGEYQELLTLDISGSGGSLITYIADVTGENTDDVGGIIRVTGSDNDQAGTRANCVDSNSRTHRTFRGFLFDLATAVLIDVTDGTDWIVEDCVFLHGEVRGLRFNGTSQASCTVRRCVFIAGIGQMLSFAAGSATTSTGHLVENCLLIAGGGDNININLVGGLTIKNCTFLGAADDHVDVAASAGTGAGQFTTINNCIFCMADGAALEGAVSGDIVEDYNTFFGNSTDRTNTATGSNSLTYPPLWRMPLLLNGIMFPFLLGELSEWSQILGITGTGEATDDIFGMARPTTAAKKSWGAFQFVDMERDTATTRGGSTASIKLADAGRHQIWVPVTNISTTIAVYVNREANYAGTNPQLVVKQPGVADDTTTDAGSSGAFNQLTTTLTPSANTDYVVVELVSNNTATSGSFATYFDDLSVS